MLVVASEDDVAHRVFAGADATANGVCTPTLESQHGPATPCRPWTLTAGGRAGARERRASGARPVPTCARDREPSGRVGLVRRRRRRRPRGLRESRVSTRSSERPSVRPIATKPGDRLQARRHGHRDRRRRACSPGRPPGSSTRARDATARGHARLQSGLGAWRSTSADGAVQVLRRARLHARVPAGACTCATHAGFTHLRSPHPGLERAREPTETPCRFPSMPPRSTDRSRGTFYRALAVEQMRPISRKYDEERARASRRSG